MNKWLRIGLYSVAVILPLGLVIFITKRFFTRNSSRQQSISYGSTNNGATSTTSRISPQVIHNYTSSTVEMTIPQSIIGFIIGRGGEKIKRIQNEADVRIRFRDQVTTSPSLASNNLGQSNDRIAVISGRPECIQLAKTIIEKMLQEKIRDEQTMEVRLLIPDWICGKLIGQRGQNIKSLQKLSGAKINIENPPENARRGDSRGCIINGTPEQIRLANELVENLVQGETFARSRRQNTRGQFRNQRISSSEYLTSPTAKNQFERMHYETTHDLRTHAHSAEVAPPKVTLLSREESVYLVYFSQQVQSCLQPLPIGQDYFTAFVSTVNRSGCVWIQLLDDVEMELNDFIETMQAYYSNLVSTQEEELEKKGSCKDLVDTQLKTSMDRETCVKDSDTESDTSRTDKCESLDTIDDASSPTQSPTENELKGCESATDYQIPRNTTPFKTGMLVAAAHSADDKYYRGIICRMDLADNEAHVYFLDFGDDEYCKLSRIQSLKQEFTTLPFQAVLCHLSNIDINSNGLSNNAFSRLQELTYCAQWKRLFVKASNNDQKNSVATSCIRQCPKITLIDTNGPDDIVINSTLIEEQLVNKLEYQHSFS